MELLSVRHAYILHRIVKQGVLTSVPTQGTVGIVAAFYGATVLCEQSKQTTEIGKDEAHYRGRQD
jgi:hypothetical protein